MNYIYNFLLLSIYLFFTFKELYCWNNWKKYEGYKVYDMSPETIQQMKFLHKILDNNDNDYLTFGHSAQLGTPLQIGIPPKDVHQVEKWLKKAEFNYKVIMDDVQSYLDAEMARLSQRYGSADNFAFDINDFNTLDDIFEEIENMAARCPDDLGVFCETYTIGLSFEGREIRMLRMYKDDSNGPRQALWIDSGIHAGEWLPPATHLKIMDLMTRNYSTDELVREFVDKYDWYFLPIMNPDGYEFTWDEDRFWRKSRNTIEDSSCNGTDLNRNFGFMWMNAGSSDDPCSNNYAGSGPASEPETQVVQHEVVRLAPTILGLVSLHSAAYMWLHPFGHVDENGECFYADDDEWMSLISDAAADAVQLTYNTSVWTRGNTCDTIYPASSTTMDWAKGAAGINYTCTPELREPFDPEPELIELSFQEIWNGIVAMVKALEENRKV